VDRAVRQSFTQRFDVFRGAQGRVDLVDRVVALGELVGEQQVVRGHFGGDVAAAALGPADDLHRPLDGDVAEVQPRPDGLGGQAVLGDDRFFGDGGPAGEPQAVGDHAFVHLGAFGEARFLGVLGDDAVERFDVFQGAAHELGVGDAHAVEIGRAHV